MLTIGFNSFKRHSQLSKHTNQFQFNRLETGIVVISVFSDDSRMEQPDFMVIVKGSLVDSVQACEFAGGVERFWHIRFAGSLIHVKRFHVQILLDCTVTVHIIIGQK